jgi:hypothetical protein
VLLCHVNVVSVTYQYSNNTFVTLDAAPTDIVMVKRVASMSNTPSFVQRVPIAVEGAGLASGNYTTSFGLELARELIAFTGSIYEPADSLVMRNVLPRFGSRIYLGPLACLSSAICLYWCASKDSFV